MNNLRYELLIRRFTETLIESKEPRREVVTNLDRWRRIGGSEGQVHWFTL